MLNGVSFKGFQHFTDNTKKNNEAVSEGNNSQTTRKDNIVSIYHTPGLPFRGMLGFHKVTKPENKIIIGDQTLQLLADEIMKFNFIPERKKRYIEEQLERIKKTSAQGSFSNSGGLPVCNVIYNPSVDAFAEQVINLISEFIPEDKSFMELNMEITTDFREKAFENNAYCLQVLSNEVNFGTLCYTISRKAAQRNQFNILSPLSN